MYFGADYYPEHWSEERWETDAKLMQEAEINVVRLAEFAWSKIEPRDGEYDFSWLDRAVDVLARYGISVVMGTPTAAAPKWLMDTYPDAYPVDMYGQTKGFGTRRHYCPNHAGYREKSAAVASAMAKHYSGNKSVVAWQIDNEFGGECYCEHCRRAFSRWLEKKYGTVDKMNTAWGTVFWSEEYSSFDEVVLPKYAASDGFAQNAGAGKFLSTPYNHNPGLLLDYRRFNSDSTVEYQQIQIDAIREYTDKPITHNFMGHFAGLDYYNLARELDFVSWDVYPNNMWGKSSPTNVSMAHDLMRGLKRQNFWIMEQQSGPCGWHFMGSTPEPGQIRLWTYQSIAHGADAVVYFRWRACLFGLEQYWYGILDHDGVPRRRYREISAIGAELKKIGGLLEGLENIVDTAIIKSYDNLWSHEGQKHAGEFNYGEYLQDWYDAFAVNNVNMDVTAPEADFNKYKLVILPAYNIVTKEFADKCGEYVKGGGTIILTFRSGIKTEYNSMTELTLPGYFAEMSGVEVEEFDAVSGYRAGVRGEFGNAAASKWCDILKCTTAEPIALYTNRYYKDVPAVTVNEYGKGRVYYVGCDMHSAELCDLADYIIEQVGIKRSISKRISGAEAVWRKNGGNEYMIVLNHNPYAVSVPNEIEFEDALGGEVSGDINLEAFGVRVLLKK